MSTQYHGLLSNANLRLDALRAVVKNVLEHPTRFEWSLQGMGMLRLHFDNYRIHIWDSLYRAPGVSMIHDHLQWGLQSLVLSGEIRNIRYVENPHGDRYMHVRLQAGYGCRFLEEPSEIRLIQLAPETYCTGESYSQEPAEIHRTESRRGTVTIMRKTSTDTGTARVFWPVGEEWGSAEPHPAAPAQVEAITGYALSVWDAEAK